MGAKGKTILGVLASCWLAFSGPAAGAEKPDITAGQAARDEADFFGLIPDSIGWSPDGRRFYYHAGATKAHRPDQNAVFEVGRDGGKPRRLSEQERLRLPPLTAFTPNPELRNFSRDGKLFVYELDGDVFLRSPSGAARRFTSPRTSAIRCWSCMAWWTTTCYTRIRCGFRSA